MNNTLKSDRGWTKSSGALILVELDKRLSLGQDQEGLCIQAAEFGLIYVVLITRLEYPRDSIIF